MKLMYKKKWSKGGWQVTSNKGEEYDMKLFVGKVKKGDDEGNLLVIGNLYIIWGVV